MMSTTQLSKKHLNLLQMPIGEHKNIIWQKPNGDLDFVSKYISLNQLSIGGVYGLFFERIYQKMYIAKFTRISFGEPNLEQMSRSTQGFFKRIQGWLYEILQTGGEFSAFDMPGLSVVRSSRLEGDLESMLESNNYIPWSLAQCLSIKFCNVSSALKLSSIQVHSGPSRSSRRSRYMVSWISSHVGRWQGSWCQHLSNSWVIPGLK